MSAISSAVSVVAHVGAAFAAGGFEALALSVGEGGAAALARLPRTMALAGPRR